MSPFRSEKQLAWLRLNKPDIYERWKKKYGIKVQPKKKKKK